MTFSKNFILEKLSWMSQYQKEIQEILRLPDSELMTSITNLHALERLFQVIVDAMIDVNQHFIKELNFEIPEDLFSTFLILGENGVIEQTFAQKLAPIVGVRNRLVHQYEKIDQRLFLKNLRESFTDFQTYSDQIQNYLSKNSAI